MRLLCLHGMYQNGKVFRAKTEHLLRVMPPNTQLVYLDGPTNLVPKAVSKPIDTSGFLAWWDPKQDKTPCAQQKVLRYVGEALDKEGPFDGILGFSQGASMASWLCSNVATRELDWTPSIAIMMGGYIDTNDAIFSHGIAPHVRSFHAYGLNDRVVPATKSEQLAALFEQGTHPELVFRHTHAQGHVVPKCDGALHALQSFLHVSSSPSTSQEDYPLASMTAGSL